jgi:Peptidoglycan-synthase activator LpoB
MVPQGKSVIAFVRQMTRQRHLGVSKQAQEAAQPIFKLRARKGMNHMKQTYKIIFVIGLGAGLMGCQPDKPHDYGQERPDVQSISPDDKGLQSKDVVAASDQMAMDLLRLPQLNDSQTQWTIVVTSIENHTTDSGMNYDVFINRLKSNLATQGHGRVQLIQNLNRFRGLQSQELETGGNSVGVQPQFALHGTVDNLPNRGTDYYLFQFDLTDLRSRQIVWNNKYEVKVAR